MMKQSALAAIAALFCPAIASAQGDLTPPAGIPAPGMKTLTQVEPRIPVSAAGTLSVRGSYYLTQNITVSSGNGLLLNAPGSTLDLNGFTIESTSATPAGTGIVIAVGDITVMNGHILGAGFLNGVYGTTTTGNNVRVRDVTVKGCAEKGIVLLGTEGTLVESCMVHTITSTDLASSRGIQARTVRDSIATDCSCIGILAESVIDCRAKTNSSAPASSLAIGGDVVTGCYAETASTSGSSLAISAGGGTVTNSNGTATVGTGIFGALVTSSYGAATSGRAIVATVISNCNGNTTSGTVMDAGNGTVSFSNALRSTAGTGISAGNAIGCTVQGTGVTVVAVNKSLGTP